MIGKFVSEMLAEGLIFRWLVRVWEALKGGLNHPAVQEWGKNKLTPKGLDDESIFSFILAKANMKKSSPPGVDKKPMLIRVLNRLEISDKIAKTNFVKNFRLIVAMDAIGRGTIKVEKKDKDGKVVEIKTMPDPNWAATHPGIAILEIMAEECNTEAEMVQFITAVGAMQDAPFGDFDEFKNWVKRTAIPNVIKFFDGAASKLGDGISALTNRVNQAYDDIELRNTAWDAMTTRQKLTPRNFWQKFMDHF